MPLGVGAERGRAGGAEPEAEERVGEQRAGGERGGRRAEAAPDRDVRRRREREPRGERLPAGRARRGEAAHEQVGARGQVA